MWTKFSSSTLTNIATVDHNQITLTSIPTVDQNQITLTSIPTVDQNQITLNYRWIEEIYKQPSLHLHHKRAWVVLVDAKTKHIPKL